MNTTPQQTLRNTYRFEGNGLHTGVYSHMTLKPAPADSGIIFHRTDLGNEAFVKATAENVSNTARSTTISSGDTKVVTIEHVMSALTGMGIDNALIEIDNQEVPILDGSARLYSEAIAADGVEQQDAPRHFIEITEEIEIRDEKTGAYIKVIPSDHPSIELTVDFGSRVLGVQSVRWDMDSDYRNGIGPCRTFVFFHEIEFLAKQGLVKGGDVDNAIVIVENPVTEAQIDTICTLLNKPKLKVTDSGYLNNLELRFPDECGRHKLLDLIGDLRLCGGFLNARVCAFKSGHSINTTTAKAIKEAAKIQNYG